MVERYLGFLKKHDARCTFFVVGDQLRAYPGLIKRLLDDGHEIACHTDTHKPLTSLTAETFRDDLDSFMNAAHALGIHNIAGFRAPVFSITKDSAWAYGILKEFGFTYSSSVLAANNPLFGWKEFGTGFKKIDGIIEMPITLHPRLNFPLAGGVYFRMLPFFIIRPYIIRLFNKRLPLQSYLHPYDIDYEQERFMHPGINNSGLYNYLMYYNRRSVFKKLEQVMSLQAAIIPYLDYIANSVILNG